MQWLIFSKGEVERSFDAEVYTDNNGDSDEDRVIRFG